MNRLVLGHGIYAEVEVPVVEYMADVVVRVLRNGVVAVVPVVVVDVDVLGSVGDPPIVLGPEAVIVALADVTVVPEFVNVAMAEPELGQGVDNVVDAAVVDITAEGELLTPAEVVPMTPVLVDETPVIPDTPVPVAPLIPTPTVPIRPVSKDRAAHVAVCYESAVD